MSVFNSMAKKDDEIIPKKLVKKVVPELVKKKTVESTTVKDVEEVEPTKRVVEQYFPFTGYGLYVRENNERVALKRLSHHVTIEDYAAKVCSTQEFVNERDAPVEMSYKFCTTNDVTPFGVEVHLHDPKTREVKVLKAKIKEKERAKEKYDDVIAEGNTAMLMEQEKDKVISLSLGNIKPGLEVKVIMESVHETSIERNEEDEEQGILTMGMEVQSMNKYLKVIGKDPVKNLNVSVEVKMNHGEIQDVKSASHESNFEVVKKDKQHWTIKTKDNISNDEDFNIKVRVKDYPVIKWLVQKKKDDLYAYMVSVIPQFKQDERETVNSEMIIIVDRSGSMSGSRMRFAKEAMKLFMSSLDPDMNIYFNIISFGSKWDSLFTEPVKLDEQNLKTALTHIEGQKANYGGTNILLPCQGVLQKKIKDNCSRQVFLLTDGEDSNTDAIIKCVKENASTTRFFTIGIGSGINPKLVESVARVSNGRAVFLSNNNTIQTQVLSQLDHALQPALSNLKIEFPADTQPTTDEKVDVMFNYRRYIKYYFGKKLPDSELSVSYQCGRIVHSHKLKPTILENPIVGTLAARSRIDHLESKKGKSMDEVLKLGLEFNLVTKKTSYLMKVINKEKITKEMQEEVIPTTLYNVTRPVPKYDKYEEEGEGFYDDDDDGASYSESSDEECCKEEERKPVMRRIMKQVKKVSLKRDKFSFAKKKGKKKKMKKKKNKKKFSGSYGKDWKAKESQSVNKAFSGSYGEDWAPKPQISKKEMDFSGFSFDTKENEKKEEKKVAAADPTLSKLLLKANISGVFEANSDISSIISISLDEIKKSNPKSDKELNLWMTAVVICYIKKKYAANKVQWNLIIRKSEKSLQKNKCKDMLAKAKTFIEKF